MKDLTIRCIKMLDITYLTIIYVTISIVFSVCLNKLIGPFNKEDANKKSTLRLVFEIYLNFTVIAIAAYLIRGLVESIPFPLDNIYDFDHSKVHELNGGIIFGFAILYYQINLCDKINYLFNERIFKGMNIFVTATSVPGK